MKATVKRGFGKITVPEFVNAVDPSGAIGGCHRDPGGNYEKYVGKILFANESFYDMTFYSKALTNYIVDWKDPNDMEATLQFFAPQVIVPGRRFEWKAATNSQEFLSETVDDERAIYADFKRVQYLGTDVVSKTLNRGLMRSEEH